MREKITKKGYVRPSQPMEDAIEKAAMDKDYDDAHQIKDALTAKGLAKGDDMGKEESEFYHPPRAKAGVLGEVCPNPKSEDMPNNNKVEPQEPFDANRARNEVLKANSKSRTVSIDYNYEHNSIYIDFSPNWGNQVVTISPGREEYINFKIESV